MNTLARVEDLHISFGGVAAASGISLTVEQGEFLALIGPNGAGKTTALRMVAGLLRPDRGRVFFGERDVTNLPAHARVRLGLGFTHQIVRPFYGFTTVENVMLAAGHHQTESPWRALASRSRAAAREKAQAILERIGLGAQAGQSPRALPLGQRKRLEVARALALDPKLLLLDEPLAGLSSHEATTMADLVRALSGQGITVVLVEHNLGEVLRVADRLVVLDAGKVLAEGLPKDVMARPDVRQAYTGVI
ncbi:ABC transporter ATP-binding protein [Reyranella sp. CPCC 100927]|uniref:ABC transporter ATP-binding protein n=1 Tax=Reyranella sp. CPCC 100927 TaxID=2599616 RepID=UPI0011B5566E|nr:ATP-binding cassette domain-containing protein [Reyranella sp. CPCC 100927]TWT12538.1 ATP-binding cassette domain-containing protein [Reyranella sp. CPCC 100927]